MIDISKYLGIKMPFYISLQNISTIETEKIKGVFKITIIMSNNLQLDLKFENEDEMKNFMYKIT